MRLTKVLEALLHICQKPMQFAEFRAGERICSAMILYPADQDCRSVRLYVLRYARSPSERFNEQAQLGKLVD